MEIALPTDQENNDNIANKSSKNIYKKKVAKKVWYPFGSPSHQHHVYSDFCHLNVSTKQFALSLANSTNIQAEIIDNIAIDKAKDIKKKFQEKLPNISLFSSSTSLFGNSLSDSSNQSTNLPPCTKKACQEMIRAIIESQQRYRLEQQSIQEEYEELLGQLEEQELANELQEAKLTQLQMNTSQLELTLQHLKNELINTEKNYDLLIAEREAFNGKFVQLEFERQNCLRELNNTSDALYSALWTNDDNESNKQEDRIIPNLFIKQSKPKDILISSNASMASYNTIARSDIIDTSERPRNTPILPYNIQNKVILPSIYKSLYYKHNKLTKQMKLNILNRSVTSIPSTNTSIKSMKRLRKANPHLNLPLTSYKGYTPTGSPNQRDKNNNEIGIDDDNHSKMTFDQTIKSALLEPLDPVFFRDAARRALFRDKVIGKIRSKDSHSSDNDDLHLTGKHGRVNGRLLTNKHPGLDLSITASLSMLTLDNFELNNSQIEEL